MGFPYRFITNPDEAQIAHRRKLLDNYGQFAQLSALIIPLFGFQLSFAIRFLVKKIRSGGKAGKARQSPRVASFAEATHGSSVLWRQFRWAMDEQIIQGWGTRVEWMIAGLWTLWLLLLVVKDTGDDYLHLTKRFGIVAASQLPLHYLLALKSWSPIQYLTRLSHEELNPYHRLLGRILTTFFAIHALLYLNFFIQIGALSKRIRDKDVILGLIANTSLMILGTTALATIRNYSYRLFFIVHVFLSLFLLPILYFHVPYLRVYIIESAAIFILLIVQRNISSTPVPATLTRLPKTNLLSISIPLSPALAKRFHTPGQHIYLAFPASLASPLNKLRLNPFTIANLPSQEHNLRLVIRPLAGTTQTLSSLTHSSKKASTPLVIEGPYGAAPYFPNLLDHYDRILLVAGGVGATFTLPIYRHLLQRLRGTDASAGKVRFVWTVRDVADAAWGMQQLADDGESDPPGCEIYVSGSSSRQQRWQRQPRSDDHGAEMGSFELEERAQFLGEEERRAGNGDDNAAAAAGSRRGRPSLRAVVDDVFGYDASDRVAVLVCGPAGLGSALRVEVGRWVGKGRKVFWHGEQFGW